MEDLSATFQTMIDTVQGNIPALGQSEVAANDAYSNVQSVLARTVLPRRITIRGADGKRMSVIAKNRRVVKLAEVHPAMNWTGDAAPEKTECQSDVDCFAGPFASALIKTVGGKPIRIEQALLADPLGATKSGYPSTMLLEHVAQFDDQPSPAEQLASFLSDSDSLARGRFGQETEITIPSGSSISHDRMQERIDEALKDLTGSEATLRFLTLEGDKPMAIAVAWLDGEGAIVLSDDPETFDDLEQKLSGLRACL